MIPKVAVVILNYNGRKFLEQFLPSVTKFNSFHAEIWLADNASSDDSVEYVQVHFPFVKHTLNAKNEGFAQGYNTALKNIKAEYYVLLNSDVEVTENWLDPFVLFMDKHPEVAACQPKIKSFLNRNYFEHAGAAGGFIDKFGYPFCRGRILNVIEEDTGQYNKPKELFWATGACLFIRSNVFHECEGFDGDFFAHMEEIDLCWRIKNKGYSVWYIPDSLVYHVGGGTLTYQSPQKTYLNFRNNLYLLFKNHPSNYFIGLLIFRMLLDGVAGVKFLFEGSFKNCLAVLKAHRDFYWNLNSLIKKRKKGRYRKCHKEIYMKSIIWDFFVAGKRKFSDLNF